MFLLLHARRSLRRAVIVDESYCFYRSNMVCTITVIRATLIEALGVRIDVCWCEVKKSSNFGSLLNPSAKSTNAASCLRLSFVRLYRCVEETMLSNDEVVGLKSPQQATLR
jgi:hypothetical protein